MTEILDFDMEDLQKVAKGALIAGAGAALTYLAGWLGAFEADGTTAVVVAVASILVNAARKYIVKTD